jgi:hypothetical protein
LAGGARTGVRSSELGVPVAEQQPEATDTVVELHDQVAGLLGHPVVRGMRRHPEHMDPPAGHLEHEQDRQPL